MSWISQTLFRDEERVKSTLALGSVAFSIVALVLTLIVVLTRL
jgi:hypothetical protein